jgi:hypothetical protein
MEKPENAALDETASEPNHEPIVKRTHPGGETPGTELLRNVQDNCAVSRRDGSVDKVPISSELELWLSRNMIFKLSLSSVFLDPQKNVISNHFYLGFQEVRQRPARRTAAFLVTTF